METIITEKKTRGRKPLNVEWPTNTFSINDILNSNKSKGLNISRITLQNKVNKALIDGIIEFQSEVKQKVGRSFRTFKIKV